MGGIVDDGEISPEAMSVARFARIVRGCWSVGTATTYSTSNPARGQCSVTAILAQEHLGGEIAKTPVEGSWHFYNVINGQRFDFTRDQFDDPPCYQDVASNKDEASADTMSMQRHALASAFSKACDRLT